MPLPAGLANLGAPPWLLLILLAPLPALWQRARPRLPWPTLHGFAKGPRGFAGRTRHVPALLRGLAIACLAVALARPRTIGETTRVAARGVAIVAAIDRSSSMNTPDFPAPDGPPIPRLEAAKRTFSRFVAGRPGDLIGLVGFANFPNRDCPPTLDHAHLLAAVGALKPARAGDDGTNLGDAIAWSLGTLKPAVARRKVLILLTDGINTPAVPRPIDPVDAATLARKLGVTLHTIAVGTPGGGPAPREPVTNLPLPGDRQGPDFAMLERLAEVGGGQAYVAADAGALEKVFRDIDALEKSPVSDRFRIRYHEAYAPWAGAALALLALDRLLCAGRLRRLP